MAPRKRPALKRGTPGTVLVKGDRVRVIRGNYREAEGTVLRVLRDVGRVVVEGVNQRKRHQRPTQENPEGGIMTFEAPIHISNVMPVVDGKPTRVCFQTRDDGSKVRLAATGLHWTGDQ